MTRSLLICDLDGTLVDSFPGIAEALRVACDEVGIAPRVPLDRAIVGPPLDEMLRRVSGVEERVILERLRACFTEAYDEWACRLTSPYPGIEDMLNSLLSQEVRLALATNKRQKPTAAILEALGWQDHFCRVETVDSRPPSARSKGQMLRDILEESGPTAAAYLGDTAADIEAACEASVTCILAAWGYGRHGSETTTLVALSPRDVIAAFARVQDL